MSRRRQAVRFRVYSLPPSRKTLRATSISVCGMATRPRSFSKRSETSAKFSGRRRVVPWKITSSILAPRSALARCSPSTQRTASAMLDLPQPLEPTMAVTPSRNSRVVRSANDLKPWRWRAAELHSPPGPGAGAASPMRGTRRGATQAGAGEDAAASRAALDACPE